MAFVLRFARPGLVRMVGLLCLWAGLPVAQAQWRTQQIPLQPGWNAVFLEVEPEPRDCATALAGVPVESVWLRNERSGAPQFISDPRKLTPESPEWLVYLPAGSAGGVGVVSTLFTLPGGRPYLVKLAGNAPATWTVKGRPRVRLVAWTGSAFNFVGFPLDPATTISVQSFFSPSSALANQAVYELDPTGEWKLITDRAGTNLRPGRAYWVFASTATQYSGPVEVTPDLGHELAFGSLGRSLSLRLANRSTSTRRLTLRVLGSEAPPAGDFSADAGPVALGVLSPDGAAFVPVTAPLSVDLGPGKSDELKLELRRQDMAPFGVPAGALGARYQGLLEVTDGAGFRVLLPLSAESNAQAAGVARGAAPNRSARAGVRPQDESAVSPFAGLWAGVVAVNAVSDPRHPSDPARPRPAGAEFQFRVLLHVDAAGVTRLLREALILFKPGTLRELPGENRTTLDTPGEYVIATDDSLLALRDDAGRPVYTGSTLRDGVSVGRRLSSMNFSFAQPLALTGGFGTAGSHVDGQFTIGFDDPLHPFKHLYHPDHDNQDREFQPYAAGGEEAWDLTRQLSFEFTAGDPDPDAPPQAGLGSTILAGRYRETITGLHKVPLRLAGIFRIQRVLNVNQLNDGR